MNKIMAALIINFIFSSCVFATKQVPDYIIIDNNLVPLETNPLEPFFEKNESQRPKGGVMSTDCWRGYVATFEIIENTLCVKKIEIKIEERITPNDPADADFKILMINVIDKVMPNMNDRKLMWCSGALILPSGNVVNYVHMGYGSTYENYQILVISAGLLVKDNRLPLKEFSLYKKSQFEKFKETIEYNNKKSELLKNDKYIDTKYIENFMFEFYSEFYLSHEFEN